LNLKLNACQCFSDEKSTMKSPAIVNIVWKVIAGLALVAVCGVFTGEGKDTLGVMYDNGYIVSQDHREAAKWYLEAAEQGNTKAQLDLAIKYALGKGVPVNYVQACKWVTIASKQNEKLADEAEAAIETYMTKEDIAIGRYMAYLWMQQHSKSAFYPVFRDTGRATVQPPIYGPVLS
jgi:hypothetical protein